MHIDPQSGTVTIPNGGSVDPSLSQDEFRAASLYAVIREQHGGRLCWNEYRFSGGRIDGKEVLVSLYYQDQTLASVDLTVDLYPPGPKDWSNYSLNVEAATKDFHDRLLNEMLGPPSKSDHLSFIDLPPSQNTLRCPNAWAFPWGTVHSAHDFKGGGTYIFVRYANRQERAS